MKRWWVIACGSLCSALLPAWSALASTDDTEVIVSPRPARALQIVPPEFPKGVEPLDHEIGVEVAGTIGLDGQMQLDHISAEPGTEAFAIAVQQVIRWWRFAPAVGDDCKPQEGRYKSVVSFAGSAGDPHVFVSTIKGPGEIPTAQLHTSFDWGRRTSPIWPRGGQYSAGEVRLVMKLTPQGKVAEPEVLTSFPAGAFDGAAREAVKQWTVRWIEEPPKAPVCVEQVFVFCMEDSSSLPFIDCK